MFAVESLKGVEHFDSSAIAENRFCNLVADGLEVWLFFDHQTIFYGSNGQVINRGGHPITRQSCPLWLGKTSA